MNLEPTNGQNRGDDAGDKRVRGESVGAIFLRNRWLVAGVLALALIVAAVAIGVASVQRANSRRADDLAKSGTAAYGRGDFADAETALSQVVTLHSQDATAQALLGRSREAQGDLSGAAQAYTASLKVNAEQPDVLYKIAVIQKSSGKNEEAIATLKQSLSADPNFFPAHLMLAQLYASTGAVADARSEYAAVIKLHPIGVDLKALTKRRDALK